MAQSFSVGLWGPAGVCGGDRTGADLGFLSTGGFSTVKRYPPNKGEEAWAKLETKEKTEMHRDPMCRDCSVLGSGPKGWAASREFTNNHKND